MTPSDRFDWKPLRVFTCKDHRGFWPVGTASVVVAADEVSARLALAAELERRGLGGKDFTLQELDIGSATVLVLNDGEY